MTDEAYIICLPSEFKTVIVLQTQQVLSYLHMSCQKHRPYLATNDNDNAVEDIMEFKNYSQ